LTIEEQFLLHDSGSGEKKDFNICRHRNLEILAESILVGMQMVPTFKVVLSLFSQIYVILAKYINGIHPLLYALLPDKKKNKHMNSYYK